MNSKRSSYVIVTVCLAALLMVSMFVAGCTSNGNTASPATPVATQAVSTPASAAVATTAAPVTTAAPTTAAQAQTLSLTGSTTVLPIAQAVADAYMKAHPEANIQVSGGGSGVGVQAIINKKVDIGMSSADVTKAQKAQDADMNIITIAHDGIAIIVNPQNTIAEITPLQVKNIYSGKVTKWTEINANVPNTNNQIVVVGRDSSSGTRTYFDSAVMSGVTETSKMHEDNSNGAVLQEVAQTPGAIGYISIGYLTTDVKAVPIMLDNGNVVIPSVTTVKDKSYPIRRDLYMITNGQPTGLAKNYLDYLLSADGQKIVVDQGYVALNS
jgi:phosphate transport system substrate-binding protein